MPLPPPRADYGDWPAEIAAAARTEMKGNVSIFEPDDVVVPYNPVTDTGGYSAPKLLSGLTPYDPVTRTGGTIARIQHIRQPTDAYSLNEWSMNTNIIVQIPLDATTQLIRKGLKVKINDGGRDSVLTGVTLIVEGAINSTQAAVRTIKCVSPLAATPAVTP